MEISAFLILAGGLLVVAGVAVLSLPAGAIVAGLGLVALGLDDRKGRRS